MKCSLQCWGWLAHGQYEDLPIADGDYWAQLEKSNLQMNGLLFCGITTLFFLPPSLPHVLIDVWVSLKSLTGQDHICRRNSQLQSFLQFFCRFFTLTQLWSSAAGRFFALQETWPSDRVRISDDEAEVAHVAICWVWSLIYGISPVVYVYV